MRMPVPPLLSLTAAIPSVGAARRAVELYRALIAERVPFGTHKVQSQRAPAQIRLAHALADVRAAETVLRAVARAIERHARGEARLADMDQIEMRLTIAHVVRDCRSVVRNVMDGSGAERALPRSRAAADQPRRADDERAHRLRSRSRRRAVRPRAARIERAAVSPIIVARLGFEGEASMPRLRQVSRDEVHPAAQESSTNGCSATAIRSNRRARRPARRATGGPCSRTCRTASITRLRASRSTRRQAQDLAEAPRARPAAHGLRARQPVRLLAALQGGARGRLERGEGPGDPLVAGRDVLLGRRTRGARLHRLPRARRRSRARRRVRCAARRARRRRDPRADLHHLHVRHARGA